VSGGNRNNGAADAVQKVVLVCGCVPECICVCRIFERISDRYVCAWRSVHRRNGCRYSDCGDPVDLTV
jgi:hypothetical protein